MSLKKFVFSSGILLSVLTLSSCANFEGYMSNNESEETATNENSTDENLEIPPVCLADINDDGKQECLVIDGSSLKLMSGSRVYQKFNIDDDFTYVVQSAIYTDIDNDGQNEIIAMLGCSGERLVYNVYILDLKENGLYELLDFPAEIKSNMAISGIDAKVTAKDNFVYNISSYDFELDIDASRIYTLSMLTEEEDYEKILKDWNKMKDSDYHGETLGIFDVKVVRSEQNSSEVWLYEYVAGGNDSIIGYLIVSLSFDANGNNEISDIRFYERLDLVP